MKGDLSLWIYETMRIYEKWMILKWKADISWSNLYPGNDHISHFFQVLLSRWFSSFPVWWGGIFPRSLEGIMSSNSHVVTSCHVSWAYKPAIVFKKRVRRFCPCHMATAREAGMRMDSVKKKVLWFGVSCVMCVLTLVWHISHYVRCTWKGPSPSFAHRKRMHSPAKRHGRPGQCGTGWCATGMATAEGGTILDVDPSL